MYEKFVEWSEFDEQDLSANIIARLIGKKPLRVLDVGGGAGEFVSVVSRLCPEASFCVVDNSPLVRGLVDQRGTANDRIDFIFENFFNLEQDERQYDIIVFRTVLHHFVGATNRETDANVLIGLKKAGQLLKDDGAIVICENFYEGPGGTDLPGRLIFEITRLKFISGIARKFGANTAGEGVRFRSFDGWMNLVKKSGFTLEDKTTDARWDEKPPLLIRLLLGIRQKYQSTLVVRFQEPQ